jgi:hypothetical protein
MHGAGDAVPLGVFVSRRHVSVGMTLYRMLSGEPARYPVNGHSSSSDPDVAAGAPAPVIPALLLQLGVGTRLAEAIDGLLSRDPARRWTAARLAKELEAGGCQV